MLICYLCGRQFGSTSLPIHIPQCQKKWMNEESKKTKRDQRLLPQTPRIAIPKAGANADAYNDAAYAQWESTLDQCPFCERRFLPEAFQHHQKACTSENPAKKAGSGLTSASLSNRLLPSLNSGTERGTKIKRERVLSPCNSPGHKVDMDDGKLQWSADSMEGKTKNFSSLYQGMQTSPQANEDLTNQMKELKVQMTCLAENQENLAKKVEELSNYVAVFSETAKRNRNISHSTKNVNGIISEI